MPVRSGNGRGGGGVMGRGSTGIPGRLCDRGHPSSTGRGSRENCPRCLAWASPGMCGGAPDPVHRHYAGGGGQRRKASSSLKNRIRRGRDTPRSTGHPRPPFPTSRRLPQAPRLNLGPPSTRVTVGPQTFPKPRPPPPSLPLCGRAPLPFPWTAPFAPFTWGPSPRPPPSTFPHTGGWPPSTCGGLPLLLAGAGRLA